MRSPTLLLNWILINMKTDFAEAATNAIKHYLDQIIHILEKVSQENDPQELLDTRLAPDMLDTGFNLAVAIRFSARALCPPAGLEVPEMSEEHTCDSLLAFANDMSSLIKPIVAKDLQKPVSHIAGEAKLHQEPADYITQYALPNMIFHLSMGYAGLRSKGMVIGKADFDGLHIYS